MSFVRSVRPSNLVILAALPFIVYLFASSPDYLRSLRAILGIEQAVLRPLDAREFARLAVAHVHVHPQVLARRRERPRVAARHRPQWQSRQRCRRWRCPRCHHRLRCRPA